MDKVLGQKPTVSGGKYPTLIPRPLLLLNETGDCMAWEQGHEQMIICS